MKLLAVLVVLVVINAFGSGKSVGAGLIGAGWDRVEAAGMERVAFENPFDGHPEAQKAMRFDGLGGVD